MLATPSFPWGARNVAEGATYVVPSSNRTDLNLDDTWKFNLGDVAGAPNVGFDDSAWAAVSLPHTWNNFDGQDGGNDYHRGIGWYRRHYTVGSSYTNRQFFLKFDAASIVADIYVNGTFAGEHQGDSRRLLLTSLRTSASARQRHPVKVNNAFNADIPPLRADFTFFGGLYRSVHLLVMDRLHVSPLDYGSPGVYLKPTNVSANSAGLQSRQRFAMITAAPGPFRSRQ